MFHHSHHRPTARHTTLALVAVASLATMAACGGDTQSADGGSSSSSSGGSGGSSNSKTIVFSPLGLQIPAMQDLAKGAQGYGKSKGLDVIVQDPALDPQKQLTDLTSIIQSGKVGGAWALAIQPAALTPLVKIAAEKKVALHLNGVPSDYGLSGMQPGIDFDNIDYVKQGQALGEELGNCINEKLGGKAEVLFEANAPGTAGKADLEGTAQKALAETAPGAKIVSTITVSERAKAQTDTGNALQGHPDIQAVLGTNDEGALGALGGFAAAGKDLPCLTEAGGNAETLGDVKSGKIYAIVQLLFTDDVAQTVDHLQELMADPTKLGEQLVVPQKVVKAGS